MAAGKPWNWSTADQGYVEVRLASWRHFSEFVHREMQNYATYIWRGQRDSDWKLEPTLDRLIRDAKVPVAKGPAFAVKHLEQFKYAARGRRGPNPPLLDDENAWWALGQHHGLATPLLDWTTSPFVAAFFAYIEVPNKQAKHCAVYALHQPTVTRRANVLAKQKDSENKEKLAKMEAEGKSPGILARAMLEYKHKAEIQIFRPLSDENQRLVSQGGWFSRSPFGKPLETWVQESQDPDDNGFTLIKVLLPTRDRDPCLRMLNRMNINHLSLFPDLYGASKFCNLFSEIENY